MGTRLLPQNEANDVYSVPFLSFPNLLTIAKSRIHHLIQGTTDHVKGATEEHNRQRRREDGMPLGPNGG
jgi:hypothetical protein